MNKKIIAIILAMLTAISALSVLSFADSIKAGDVNGDGKISAADARLVLRASASLGELTPDQQLVAEVTGDGKISAADARLILRAAAELDTLPEITVEPDSETDEETTEAPTAEEPTTEEPTTEEPTTEEPTTEEPATEEPATGEVVTDYPEAIKAFFKGKFYMEGVLSEEDNSMVILATNGKSTEMSMSMEGFDMSIYATSKKLYIKFPYSGKKYYVEMTEETMASYGIDFDIDSIVESLTFGSVDEYGAPVLTTEEYEDAEYSVYTFTSNDGSQLCFYADDAEDIKYIISKNASGQVDSSVRLNALSATIPSNMLTIKGYSEGSLFTLMNAIMALENK